jgi:hypothetical protein
MAGKRSTSSKSKTGDTSTSARNDNVVLPVSKQTAGGIAGAALGGLIGGPMGAVVGGVAGAMVGDASPAERETARRVITKTGKEAKSQLKKAVKLIKSDTTTKPSTSKKSETTTAGSRRKSGASARASTQKSQARSAKAKTSTAKKSKST